MKVIDKNIFEVQPSWCRELLPKRDIVYSEWTLANHPEYIEKWERIMYFDPTEIYEKIAHRLNPYKRLHNISISLMFPDIQGYCACGCGVKLGGRKKRWASEMCSSFAWDVRSIICNAHQRPGFYIDKYRGNDCVKCGESGLHDLDHMIGIKHGGGACWLSNYQFLCKKCHRNKTNEDFGWNKKSEAQLDLFNK